MKKFVYVVILLLSVGVLFYFLKGSLTSNSIKVSDTPIHWHPHLRIIINGEEQIIPANIGLGAVESPIHTHETDGILHMENEHPSADTVVLGYFFKVWGKAFNKECIFEYCTDKGSLKMTVNGKENNEFEKYFMQDKDEIVIEYQSNA